MSPTTADAVRTELGADVDAVLDGGACAVGVESTIVELVGERPMLLRPGAVTVSQLEAVLGEPIAAPHGESRAPGMLASHYAPAAVVEIVTADALDARASALRSAGKHVVTIVPSADLEADARALYARHARCRRGRRRRGARRLARRDGHRSGDRGSTAKGGRTATMGLRRGASDRDDDAGDDGGDHEHDHDADEDVATLVVVFVSSGVIGRGPPDATSAARSACTTAAAGAAVAGFITERSPVVTPPRPRGRERLRPRRQRRRRVVLPRRRRSRERRAVAARPETRAEGRAARAAEVERAASARSPWSPA